ncbi:hypothetical protein BGZ46_000978 [Entomortierella lignicola]|nr:hypothetical protein BGZ46_000978 [Entomortierella lignicola]
MPNNRLQWLGYMGLTADRWTRKAALCGKEGTHLGKRMIPFSRIGKHIARIRQVEVDVVIWRGGITYDGKMSYLIVTGFSEGCDKAKHHLTATKVRGSLLLDNSRKPSPGTF